MLFVCSVLTFLTPFQKEDDELMQDWQMIVKRLNVVTKTNKEILTYLLKQAKLAVQKQEVVKKLDQIDRLVRILKLTSSVLTEQDIF